MFEVHALHETVGFVDKQDECLERPRECYVHGVGANAWTCVLVKRVDVIVGAKDDDGLALETLGLVERAKDDLALDDLGVDCLVLVVGHKHVERAHGEKVGQHANGLSGRLERWAQHENVARIVLVNQILHKCVEHRRIENVAHKQRQRALPVDGRSHDFALVH